MHADADAGRTVVFATHYLEEADAFAGADRDDLRRAHRRRRTHGADPGPGHRPHRLRSTAAGRCTQVLARLRSMPHVIEATTLGSRVTVTSTDSDAAARDSGRAGRQQRGDRERVAGKRLHDHHRRADRGARTEQEAAR